MWKLALCSQIGAEKRLRHDSAYLALPSHCAVQALVSPISRSSSFPMTTDTGVIHYAMPAAVRKVEPNGMATMFAWHDFLLNRKWTGNKDWLGEKRLLRNEQIFSCRWWGACKTASLRGRHLFSTAFEERDSTTSRMWFIEYHILLDRMNFFIITSLLSPTDCNLPLAPTKLAFSIQTLS